MKINKQYKPMGCISADCGSGIEDDAMMATLLQDGVGGMC